MDYTVYLAGGISNISEKDYKEWRKEVTSSLWCDTLCGSNIFTLDPCNSDDWINESGLDNFENETYKKDLYDIKRCDLVFVNFLPSKQISIGTVVEIGYAKALGKPIVVVMNRGNVHEHIFIHGGDCVYLTDNLDTGIKIAKNLLLPK